MVPNFPTAMTWLRIVLIPVFGRTVSRRSRRGDRVVRWLKDGRLLPTQGLGHARVLDDRGVAGEIVAHLA